MKIHNYFYNCSKEFIESIDPNLYNGMCEIIYKLPKRSTQAEVNIDLFWLLTNNGWSYDTVPAGLTSKGKTKPPADLDLNNITLIKVKKGNDSSLCNTSTTLNVGWHSDFAKSFDEKLVQVEAQFGKTESMFKDFCGFKIANFEKRLTLGVEIVISEPNKYFSHRKKDISGMSNFNIAKETLFAINLNCPIWLIGIGTDISF